MDILLTSYVILNLKKFFLGQALSVSVCEILKLLSVTSSHVREHLLLSCQPFICW